MILEVLPTSFFWDALMKIEINQSRLCLAPTPLRRFSRDQSPPHPPQSRMVELPSLGQSPPPPPEIFVHEVETKDGGALKQGKVDESLELITLNPAHPEATVRNHNQNGRQKRQQLK